jgi:hypothetical protein
MLVIINLGNSNNKGFQYGVAGRVGFEPTTSSLEGWLAIRAATSAQQSQNKDEHSCFKVSYRQ